MRKVGTNRAQVFSGYQKTIQGHFLIKPEVLHWRSSSLMRIPNAD
jgi:hypothetical protein